MVTESPQPYSDLPISERFLRLQEAGFSDERVSRALEAAFSQASSVDEFFASNARGTLLYHYTVGELGHLLCSEVGWTHDERRAQKRFVSPDQTFEVIVITGDGATGLPETEGPQPNNAKGAATRESVRSAQLTLPGVESIFPQESASTRDLWILVIHGSAEEMSWEISRPDWMSPDGRRVAWGHRHCGELITPLVSDVESGETGDDIEIEIGRK